MAGDLEAGTYESMTVPVPETTYVPSTTPSTTTTTIAGSPSPTKDDDEEGEDKETPVSSSNAFFPHLRFPTTDDLVEFGKYMLIVFGSVLAVVCAVLLVMLLFWAFTELLLTCSDNLKKVGGGGE